jgi:oligoribonuclease
VAVRNRDGEARSHEGPTKWREHDRLCGDQIAPRITVVGVRRELRLGRETGDLDFHVHRLPVEGSYFYGTNLSSVLVWMDLEMTGLELARHVIIEIATLITDDDLTIVAEGPDLVIGASDENLAQMGDFVRAMHTTSGLLTAVQSSPITMAEAEQQTLDFLHRHVASGIIPLAGNSIGTDRRFLQEYMPTLESFFHYRNVDVSTIKELGSRWFPGVMNMRPEKATTHRALDDIKESIAELAFYRDHLFQPSVVPKEQ